MHRIEPHFFEHLGRSIRGCGSTCGPSRHRSILLKTIVVIYGYVWPSMAWYGMVISDDYDNDGKVDPFVFTAVGHPDLHSQQTQKFKAMGTVPTAVPTRTGTDRRWEQSPRIPWKLLLASIGFGRADFISLYFIHESHIMQMLIPKCKHR